MELNKILEVINGANDRYRTLKLSQTIDQSEILRDLSVSYSDLTDHKIKAREQWLDIYNGSKGSNASKERQADSEVLEYDMIKDIMKACELLMNSIRSTLSANKNV